MEINKRKNMKLSIKIKNAMAAILVAGLLMSCDELSENAEGRINEIIDNRTEQLDSIVNNKLDSVTDIDSLVNNASSRIDSIASENIEALEIFGN